VREVLRTRRAHCIGARCSRPVRSGCTASRRCSST
jgi:hypothetical protein